MSYCVNCGVELDDSAKKCVLCNTPVVHPGRDMQAVYATPFPQEKGTVEAVNRNDFAILLSTFVLATAVTCGLLNALVFTVSRWSLAVIGVCVILWVSIVPLIVWRKLSVYASLFLDGLAITLYLYMLAHMVDSFGWCYGLGLPIVMLVVAVAELLALSVNKLPRSFLTVSLYINMAIGVACTGIECLIDRYIDGRIVLSWSAVVMTICIILAIAIITMLSRRRLRSAVRRRLHF